MKRVRAQARVELILTLRRGESVLLTFAIPLVILVFFSLVDVLPTGTDDPVEFLLPGVLSLAVMSTAMVGLAIATGFERSMGVLKRLGATPLTRGELLGAKATSVLLVEAMQVVLLVAAGYALGWRGPDAHALLAVAAMVLATVAFCGLGMLMAGTLPALTTLAVANGLYLVLLLLGGMVVPLDELGALEPVARLLPAAALSEIVHASLGGASVPAGSWAVLAAWAVAAPAAAAARFRWE